MEEEVSDERGRIRFFWFWISTVFMVLGGWVELGWVGFDLFVFIIILNMN